MNKQVIEVLNKQVADWSVLFTKLHKTESLKKFFDMKFFSDHKMRIKKKKIYWINL